MNQRILRLAGLWPHRAGSTGYASVLHDPLSVGKFSEYILIIIRIGNKDFILFLLWILVHIQGRMVDDHNIADPFSTSAV